MIVHTLPHTIRINNPVIVAPFAQPFCNSVSIVIILSDNHSFGAPVSSRPLECTNHSSLAQQKISIHSPATNTSIPSPWTLPLVSSCWRKYSIHWHHFKPESGLRPKITISLRPSILLKVHRLARSWLSCLINTTTNTLARLSSLFESAARSVLEDFLTRESVVLLIHISSGSRL